MRTNRMKEGTTADESGQPMSWILWVYGGVLADFRHNEETRIPVERKTDQCEWTGLTESQKGSGTGGHRHSGRWEWDEMWKLVRLYSEKLDPQVLTLLGINHTIPFSLSQYESGLMLGRWKRREQEGTPGWTQRVNGRLSLIVWLSKHHMGLEDPSLKKWNSPKGVVLTHTEIWRNWLTTQPLHRAAPQLMSPVQAQTFQ